MMHNLHTPASARLTAIKRNLEESRHGGFLLTGDDLEALIREIGEIRIMTCRLEDASPGVLRRAAADDRAAEVLTLMRQPNSNIIAPDFGRN